MGGRHQLVAQRLRIERADELVGDDSVAAHEDILLLDDRHDAAIVLARIATPDDLELHPRHELLQQEVLGRGADMVFQLGRVTDETQPGAVFRHLGLEVPVDIN